MTIYLTSAKEDAQYALTGDCLDLIERGNVFATGLGWVGGMNQSAFNDQVYVSQPLKGSVMSVHPTESRDYRFQPPVVQGLTMPTCVRFSPDGDSMFVCSLAVGGVWRVRGVA